MAFCEEGNHKPYLKAIKFDEPEGWLTSPADLAMVPPYEGRVFVVCAICGFHVVAPLRPCPPAELGAVLLAGIDSCIERMTFDQEKLVEIQRRERQDERVKKYLEELLRKEYPKGGAVRPGRLSLVMPPVLQDAE